jgi:thiol:disulfide interchange protein DsbA
MHAIRIIVFALLAVLAGPVAFALPVAGRDYTAISPAQPTSEPARIVVTKFFSYMCPHCFGFAQPFDAWSKTLPPDVKTERVAVSIGHSAWEAAAQAYYALAALKALGRVEDAIFTAIHRKGARLDTESRFAEWLGGNGVDETGFSRAYRSFSVQAQTKRADTLSRSHRIPGVPALAIDGRHLISIVDDGRFDDQLDVAEELIEKIRRERAKRNK